MSARQRRGDAGFTLLEILVAVSVMGVVLVLLTQAVQFGLRSTRLQANFRDRDGDLIVIDHALRGMIARADPGTYPEPASLRGSAQRMTFTTELPLNGDGQMQRADVALSVEAGRLLLRWTPHRHAELYRGEPDTQDTVMLDGVERLELAYWTSGAWSSVWNANKLPELVRIRLVFPGGNGRQWPPVVVAPVCEALEE
jgi:general secretion pathway protein J